MNEHEVCLTDTFGGEPNYCFVRKASVAMPEITHYGYDGTHGYTKASKAYERELMRKAKAACGLTSVEGRKENVGDYIYFYPYGENLVMIVD